METEHYGDGQHNGGIFNNKNLNTYGYCYGNPVAYIDPNGKQTKVTNPGVIFNADVTQYRASPKMSSEDKQHLKYNNRINNTIYQNAFYQNSEQNTTHIYAHGGSWSNSSYLTVFDENRNPVDPLIPIHNTQTMKNWLKKNDISSGFLSEKNHVLILHSCLAGATDNSLAEVLAKENKSTGLITVGATGNVLYSKDGKYEGTATNGRENKGTWDVYQGDNKIHSFPWDWKPNANEVKKVVENYKKKEE